MRSASSPYATAEAVSALTARTAPLSLTVRTGHEANRTTRSATLPMSSCSTPPRPCVPMTIRSMSLALACSTMVRAGVPNTTASVLRNDACSAGVSCVQSSVRAPSRHLSRSFCRGLVDSNRRCSRGHGVLEDVQQMQRRTRHLRHPFRQSQCRIRWCAEVGRDQNACEVAGHDALLAGMKSTRRADAKCSTSRHEGIGSRPSHVPAKESSPPCVVFFAVRERRVKLRSSHEQAGSRSRASRQATPPRASGATRRYNMYVKRPCSHASPAMSSRRL